MYMVQIHDYDVAFRHMLLVLSLSSPESWFKCRNVISKIKLLLRNIWVCYGVPG